MVPTFEQSLRRDVTAYVALAEEVDDFLARHALAKGTAFKVRLVLEEAVLNLIDHAAGSATDRVGVRVAVESERVVIEVEDDGTPFDPRSRPAFDKSQPLEQRAPRGMGIQLIRSVAREIDYERAGPLNRLRVVVAR